MIMTINFLHRYHKLDLDEFTTVRGPSWLKSLRPGEKVRITLRNKWLCDALVTSMSMVRVGDMAVEFLNQDAEYQGGKPIASHQDFIDLLNSFRSPAWKQATIDDKLVVIHLKRVTAIQLRK